MSDARSQSSQPGSPPSMTELVIRGMVEAFATTSIPHARGYVAAQCLAALISNHSSAMDPSGDELRVRRAVEHADALIAEIQRTQPLFDKLQASRTEAPR